MSNGQQADSTFPSSRKPALALLTQNKANELRLSVVPKYHEKALENRELAAS
jgi:hypothetical protein